MGSTKNGVKSRTRLDPIWCSVLAGFILIFGSLVVGCHQGWCLEDWKDLKGDHFLIYYSDGEERFAGEVLRKAEKYYKQVSQDLGYQRYSNFWQWEDRVKIYLYSTREQFLEASGGAGWSHGIADYNKKEITTYVWKDGFLESLLPHEITHLIFRDYVGFEGEIPVWLDEGVAQWEEPERRAWARRVMQGVLRDGNHFSLNDLTSLDVRKVTDKDQVGIFYIQAVSLVDFLVEKYGSQDFIAFCRELRDGKSLEEALRFTFPTSMRNLNELEEKWKKYILQAEA